MKLMLCRACSGVLWTNTMRFWLHGGNARVWWGGVTRDEAGKSLAVMLGGPCCCIDDGMPAVGGGRE